MNKEKQIASSYSLFQERVGDLEEKMEWQRVEQMLDKVPTSKNILDIACGDGRYIKEIHSRGYNNVFAVDLLDKITFKEVKYFKTNFVNLPFDDSYFDLCYCLSAIYYSDEIDLTIKEWNRVMKKGAYIVISGHTKYSIFTLIRILKKTFFLKKYPHIYHITFYDPKLILSLLESNGFEIVEHDGYFISWIDRIFKNNYFSGFLNKYSTKRIRFNNGYHYVISAKKL